MGIPLAALAVQQPPSPLDQTGKLLALQRAVQQQQLGAQELQQQQYQFGATKAMNEAYKGAVTVDANGQPKFDTEALTKSLSNAGYGSEVPTILKHVTDFQKSQADLADTNQKIAKSKQDMQVQQTDMLGSVGAAIKAANYDPGFADTFLQHFELNNPQSKPEVDQVRQQIQQNPAMVKQAADRWIAGSPAQQKMENERTVAGIRANNPAMQEMNDWLAKNPDKGPADFAQFKAQQNPEQRELNDYLAKHPGKGPSDFAAWKASLAPQAQINVQGAGVPTSSSDPLVQSVANGSMKIGDVLTPRTPLPLRKKFLDAVMQANPQFNSANYDIEKGIAKDFTVGKSAQELKAFNTAALHADLLGQAAKALDNGDVQALNSAKNALKTQFGSADVTNFSSIANVYEHEVLKALGGHVTDAEVREAGAMIPANASPAQIKGALANLKTMMQSKITVLKQQYEAGKNAQPNFGASDMIYARDPQGKLHSAKAGTALPAGWKQEKAPQ